MPGIQSAREHLPDTVATAGHARRRAPKGVDWVYEIKLDGYRILARREGSR